MNRRQLEHVLRAAARITGDPDVVVIGSQSILGSNHTTQSPQGGELSTGDKANNRSISSLRSAVERCIAHLKNRKILATGCRGRLSELPNILHIIAALEFYRLDW